MDPKALLVFGVAVVMLWYALGMLYNIRRGNRLLKWMEGGLPRLGQKTTFRWLGSTVAELVINQGKADVRKAAILATFTPRDIPWNWALAVLSGRRDVLILRMDLPRSPMLSLDWSNPKSWTGRMALNEVRREGWLEKEHQGQTLAAPAGLLNLAETTLAKVQAPAAAISSSFDRIALRKESPHLELHLPMPDFDHIDADAFFAAVQTTARAAYSG